jgi:hypothetical protein
VIKVESTIKKDSKGNSKVWLEEAHLHRLSHEGQMSTPFWRLNFTDGPNAICIDLSEQAASELKAKLNKRKDLV